MQAGKSIESLIAACKRRQKNCSCTHAQSDTHAQRQSWCERSLWGVAWRILLAGNFQGLAHRVFCQRAFSIDEPRHHIRPLWNRGIWIIVLHPITITLIWSKFPANHTEMGEILQFDHLTRHHSPTWNKTKQTDY